MERIRLFVVDQNDDLLDGITAWTVDCSPFVVVGRAHSAAEALERIESLRPEVVLMDVSLPDRNGFDVTRTLKARPAAPIVVLMSFHDSRTARDESLAAGADDWVSKDAISESLVHRVSSAIRRRWAERSAPGATSPHETNDWRQGRNR